MDRLIIDGNSIGYANQNGAKLTIGSGFQTQAIFGFIKSMRALLEQKRGWSDLVLWDGHAQWRFDLYPGYKADRDKDPQQALMRENYKKAKPFIQKSLQFLGMRQLTVLSAEADDMAGYFVKTLTATKPDTKIELISGDQDWIQLVNQNTSWFDPIRDQRVHIGNLFDFTGYETPYAFMQGKALQGDTSDKINGVGGIGKGTAPLFLAQFKTVEEFFRRVDSGEYVPKKKVEQRFGDINGEGRAIFERNVKLMNLLDVPKPNPQDVIYTEPQFDKEKFKMICERMNFMSILNNFDNFIRPFEERTK